MPNHDDLFSPADLLAVGVQLRPIEVVTIIAEIIRQVLDGRVQGIPSVHVLRVSREGTVTIEGPVDAGSRDVRRVAHLLDGLLPGFDASPEFHVPGALRLVVARALGTLDLPPFQSLDEFAHALARFGSGDPAATIREVARRCAEAFDAKRNAETPATMAVVRQPRGEPMTALTISDIRRARRATGLTLSDIARRSRIPLPLLRQMEWGYLVNWPEGPSGRTHLVRYARAAGLDDELVVRTVWPLVEEFAQGPPHPDAEPAALVGEIVDDDLTLIPARAATGPSQATWRQPTPWFTGVAAAALLIVAVIPLLLGWFRPNVLSEATRVADRVTGAPATPLPQQHRVQSAAPARPAPGEVSPSEATASVGRPARFAHPADTPGRSTFSPSFTTPGTAIFYHAKSGDHSSLMRADTTADGVILRITRVVDDHAQNFHARPSPDGARIAFDSDRDGERAVYIADADGRNVQRVSGDGFAAIPSWSPDGGTLAYVRAEPGHPQVWNLWTTELDTGRTRRLTSFKYGQPWGASWFPDGHRIAYSHEDRLVVLDIETGRERIYRTPVKGRLIRTPAVSPDGRRVVFQVRRDGTWLLDVADGSMRKILEDPSAEEYAWSPDGRQVAYHSDRAGGWGVWIMAAR